MLMGTRMIRLAEVASIILCTCFPMMPRLVKLISDRRAKSKPYSTPPSGQAWKQKIADGSTDEDSSGIGSAGSQLARQTARLKHPYEQLGGGQNNASNGSVETGRTEDIELAMWDTLDVRSYGDLLEQRLNVGFNLPQFSYS